MQKLLRILLCGALVSLGLTFCAWTVVFKKYGGVRNERSEHESAKNWNLVQNSHHLGRVKQESLHFISDNPCTAPDNKTTRISGSRFAKCITEAEPLMLTGECPSRLGNQMFSYATLIAISVYNNRLAYMSPSMSNYISKYFNVSTDTIEPKLYKSIKWSQMGLGGKVNNDVIRSITKPYVKFAGVPQVWPYFDEIRPRILQELKFYDHIVQKSKKTLGKIKGDENSATLVGIHIRRGDYLKRAKTAKFHLPTLEFYTGAMDYFAEKYENVIFVVASNDVAWCKKNFGPLKGRFKMNILQGATEKDGGLDLAVLVHCDHIIYGLGTFGFWAGYLNPGEVIYCSDCITTQTGWLRNKLIYNGDYGNCVLPSWIGYTLNGTQSSQVAKTTDIF